MTIEVNKKLPTELTIMFKVVKEYGHDIDSNKAILDFGCGSGKMVNELRKLGFNAFGCGTRFITEKEVDTESMMNQSIIRTIDLKNYKLPFEDNSFDIIYSQSVFEHVRNFSETISEISRILKPDGCCIHFFPARYLLKEPHVNVPFATVIQNYSWLYLWATLGIRNEWTSDFGPHETADWFHNYLKGETNYLSKNQLSNHFGSYFDQVIFCEGNMLKHSPGKRRYIYQLSKVLPFIPAMWSTFRNRAIMTRLPKKVVN